MQSVLDYVRKLLNFSSNELTPNRTYKRVRVEDDHSSDEENQLSKKFRSSYFGIMSSKDNWELDDKPSTSKYVRYVPIHVETGHPNTSTANASKSRIRSTPIKIGEMCKNRSSTPIRNPKMLTPVFPVYHAVVDDSGDEETTWRETVRNASKKPTKLYINLDEDENDLSQADDDVIFVKQISPPPRKPYRFYVADNSHDVLGSTQDEPVYLKLKTKSDGRSRLNRPSKIDHKFKLPPGITKTYRHRTRLMPNWMQTHKHRTLKFNKVENPETGTKMYDLFDLTQKNHYQDLITKVATSVTFDKPLNLAKKPEKRTKPINNNKPLDTAAQDEASFRLTKQALKNSSNEIKLMEKYLKAHSENNLNADKENTLMTEYDPITVASLTASDSEIEIVPSETSSSSQKIERINSLKHTHRDNEVTETDWLSKVDSKYRTKKQAVQEQLADAHRESCIISKLNYEQKLAHIEAKLKNDLSILPESIIPEQESMVELPPLTPEQEQIVNSALGAGPPGQLLVEKFNLRIHRRDLQTLSGLNWLNDEVINFYMNLLMQRSEEKKDLPKVYATNTFFYPKLMQSGQAGLKRWTRKVDIFAHDLLIVPIHLDVHWCVSIADFRAKKLSYLDSMGGKNQPCLDALMQYLHDEHKDKKGSPFNDSGWQTECLKDIPQQMNGSDCGMFACTFAEFSCRNAPYTFSQMHMPYLRRKAAFEILIGKLLL